MELSGLAGKFALLIAKGFLRLGTVRFGHDRALLLQLLIPRLQVVLHGQQFTAPGCEFVLERLHGRFGLRRLLEQFLEIDDAHFDFRARLLRAQETAQAQGQERNAAIESRHVDL